MRIGPAFRKRAVHAVACFVIIFSAGCTGSAPEILEYDWHLSHRFDTQTLSMYEQLSVFFHVRDADGDDDIESIYFLHDGAEVYFRLEADSWEIYEESEETWLGNSQITMYRRNPFPRGAYRVIVIDRAGERAEGSFYVSSDVKDPGETQYPILSFLNSRISLESPYDRQTFWFYDGSGSVVKLHSTNGKEFALTELLSERERSRVTGVSVYSHDDRTGIGIISGVYPVE